MLLFYIVYKINGLPSLTYSRFAKPQQNLSYSSLLTPRFSPFWLRISHTPTERQRAVIATEDHPANLIPSFTQHAHLHDEMAAADGSVVLFANLLSEISCTQAVLPSVRQPTAESLPYIHFGVSEWLSRLRTGPYYCSRVGPKRLRHREQLERGDDFGPVCFDSGCKLDEG